MKKKKKSKVPATKIIRNLTATAKFPFARCRYCVSRYYGVEKSAVTGEVLRIMSCQDSCFIYENLRNGN